MLNNLNILKCSFMVMNILFVLSLPQAQAALPEIPENSEKAQVWKTRRIATIQAVQNDPARKIPELFEMLRQLKTLGYRKCPERDEIINLLESNLLSTPGHAKYYQDKIEAMRDEVLAYSKKSDEEIMKMQDEGLEITDDWTYERYCESAFRVLSLLPSAENVGVLGYYLNDPIGRDGKTLLGNNRHKPGDDFDPRSIHSEQAARAIRSLGIEHPPFKAPVGREHEFLSEGEVDAWKNWWNEVKDGKRTYRFIGSSIEYGADGLASKEVIERATMNRKRDEERSVGKRTANPDTESVGVIPQLRKPSTIAGLLAACALVAGAVWYFLKGRKLAR